MYERKKLDGPTQQCNETQAVWRRRKARQKCFGANFQIILAYSILLLLEIYIKINLQHPFKDRSQDVGEFGKQT